jgi:hypothetical protein
MNFRLLASILCASFFSAVISPTLGQNEAPPERFIFGGNVRYLHSAFVLDNFLNPLGGKKDILTDHLLHNRLNFKYLLNENLVLTAEMRNRFFWGDQPKIAATDFSNQLNAANDYLDLSLEEADVAGIAAQVMLDRLYLEITASQLEIRIGRQRVNWGISTLWNPNDIFNAYNFTDFDYEERPGSDALRVSYYTSMVSSVEICAAVANSLQQSVVAGIWKSNFRKYDFQLLGGYFKNELVLGGGWAGQIGEAGFKGEISFFSPLDSDSTRTSLAITSQVDYQFDNSLYVNGGILYNSNGMSKGDISTLFDFSLSAKNLYPFRYSIFGQAFYPLNPILNAGGAVIYSPTQAQALFLNPSLSYSIATNWDIDLVGQIVFSQRSKSYVSPVQAAFFRLKWSL